MKMIKYTNDLIGIPININVNIRNKTKLVDWLRWYPYQITFTPAAYNPRQQNLVPNDSGDTGMRPYDNMYSKYLIFIFTNIKGHKKNKSKIVEN